MVCDAIASTLEHFNLIVKSLHEAAVFSTDKIVCNFFHVTFERFQETVKACEFAIDDPLNPAFYFSLSLTLRLWGIENRS